MYLYLRMLVMTSQTLASVAPVLTGDASHCLQNITRSLERVNCESIRFILESLITGTRDFTSISLGAQWRVSQDTSYVHVPC